MKTYLVQPVKLQDPEDYSIVKAETRAKAIYKSELYPDFDYIQLKATRIPFLDDKPLTDLNLYLSHWFFLHCRDCGQVADDGDGGDPLFDEKGRAYCAGCRPDLKTAELIKV